MTGRIKVVPVAGKGLATLTTCEYLPGAEIYRESSPLLWYDDSITTHFDDNEAMCAYYAAYRVFKTILTTAEQERVLQLSEGENENRAELLRQAASDLDFSAISGATDTVTDSEIDLFARISCICSRNLFQRDSSYFIFESASRINHSCLPNCYLDINTEKRTCTCRAILPIRKNEELTIEYNTKHRWEPTHERRFQYLASKEFTCHCPRCDAAGDDMRQCDCFAQDCGGVMMVCQPINTKPIPGNISTYSGVEYAPPHLLPCTVCHRAPPAAYEKEMLAMEAILPAKLDAIEVQNAELARTENKEAAQDLLAQLCTFADQCPGRHKLALQAKRLKGFLYTKLSQNFGSYYHEPLARAMQENIDVYEHLTLFPNKAAYQFYVAIAEASRLNPAFPVHNTAKYYRHGLRMQLVMLGREQRERSYDKGLLSVLCALPTEPATLSQCAFCEETPLRAALTLRCCGKCKKVAYCSAGCQKAHWKLHKKACKAKHNSDEEDEAAL